jgi:hypothetical protein
MDGRSAHRKACTYTGQNNTEGRGYTSMPRVGFEPTMSVFERSKTIRVLDWVTTGTGSAHVWYQPNLVLWVYTESCRANLNSAHRLNATTALSDIMVQVELSLCFFKTEYHAMKAYGRSGDIAPRILDLGTKWRWVVSFTSRPLYLHGKSPWYPLDRSMPQSRSGRGDEKNS